MVSATPMTTAATRSTFWFTRLTIMPPITPPMAAPTQAMAACYQ
jgi:hypothetical protein